MATVTPNFNWPVPTSTDLVKDGATAIEALGDSIDASLVDLKGGTTGQVLSKTSGTDMDFTWVTTDDANAIQNSIVDAKGDLISATANDTPARLAVGANGETLVADSSTSTGLRYQATQAAGKNALINGNFDIWQRGTSFSGSGYTADRWTNGGAFNNATLSQQTTGAPAGSRYIARITSTGATSYMALYQYMETATVAQLIGQTVTFSIKMRINATVNNSGFVIRLAKNSAVDATSVAGGWTDIASTTVALASIPTTAGTSTATYFTATVTATIPNDGTANSLLAYMIYNGATASGSILELSQAQLEIGSVPTAFTRAGGTIQGELAACQRYYYRTVADSNYTQFGNGSSKQTNSAQIMIPFPVTMRTAPSALTYGSLVLFDGSTIINAGTVTLNYCGRSVGAVDCLTASVQTQFRSYFMLSDNTTAGFIAFSAEL